MPKGKQRAVSSPLSSPVKGDTSHINETTYHRRLISLLLEHRKGRTAFTEAVLRSCLPAATRIVDLRNEIAASMAHSPPSSRDDLVQELYAARQMSKLEEYCIAFANTVITLSDCKDRLKSTEKKMYALLLEASRRGLEFAFLEPFYLTWTLEKFANAMAYLTQRYISSFQLVQNLFEELCNHSTDAHTSQAALSFLACQPLLPSPASMNSGQWLDDVCRVEIPEWTLLTKS